MSGTMSAMSNSSLLNLSGRAIPVNARIAISGEPVAGGVLVIESFDGISGSACWRTEAELKIQREKPASRSGGPSSSSAPKPRAPYS
jgi:hypothetical protein